jgi:hypothetical protein
MSSLGETAVPYRFQGPEDRKKAFRSAIDADVDHKVFNDQFMEGLGRRLESLTATIRHIDNIGYAILFYLAAIVLSLHFPISVFGFSFSDSKNARELLLIVWFSLHYYRMQKGREQVYCEELLECLLEKRAGSNRLALTAMMLRYGIEPGPFQLVQKMRARGPLEFSYCWDFHFCMLSG